MTIYAIFSGNDPFKDINFANRQDSITQIILGKLRPSIPQSCPKEITMMMVKCWDGNPSKRPTFVEIHSTLKFPQLDTDEAIMWKSSSGIDFSQLCELLKTNAIPAKKLEVTSMLCFFQQQ